MTARRALTATAVAPPDAAELTCETILDPAVVESLYAEGWNPAPKEWSQFGFEPSGLAFECPWGFEDDTHSRAYYAWAALAPGERDYFVSLTEVNGYIAEVTDEGTWLRWPHDDVGVSGILVTEDWVAVADTPERIDDIILTR